MFLFIALFISITGAAANDLPTGLYYKDGNDVRPVFQVDRHGDKLSFNMPEKPAEHKRAATLLGLPPNTDLEVDVTQGSGGKRMTLKQVFDLEYEFAQIEVEKRGKKVSHLKVAKKEKFKICEDSRTPLGKLLLCLKRSDKVIESYIASIRETLADVDDPAIRAELESKMDTMQQMKVVMHGTYVGLNKQYQLGELFWNIPQNQSVNAQKGITANNLKWPRRPKDKEKEEPPPPIDVSKNKSGRYHQLLQDCAYELEAYTGSSKHALDYMGKVACQEIRGQIPPFVEYNADVVTHITLDAYFDLLRSKAVEKFAKATRALTGYDLDPANLPNQCYPLDRDLRRFAAEPKTQKPLKDSVAYAYEIHDQAKRVASLQKSAGQLKKMEPAVLPIFNCELFRTVDRCKQNHSIIPKDARACEEAIAKEKEMAVSNAQQLLQKIDEGLSDASCISRDGSKIVELIGQAKQMNIAEITDIVGRYPFLANNHSGSDIESNLPFVQKFAQAKPPHEVRKVLDEAAKESARSITKAAHKFCQKMDSDDWEWLVGMDSLHDAVVADIPELKGIFDSIHRCAKREKKEYDDNIEMLSTVSKATCLAAALGSVGIMGPVCMLASVPDIYSASKDMIDGHKEREFTRNCIQANSHQPEFRDNVCTSKDYVAAMARYEDAVANFRNTMIGAGVDGLDLYKNIKNFQLAAKYMNPEEVGDVIELMGHAKTAADVNELGSKMDEIVATKGGKS